MKVNILAERVEKPIQNINMPSTQKDTIKNRFCSIKTKWQDNRIVPILGAWYEGQLDGYIEYANIVDPEFAEELLDLKQK